MPGSPVNAYGYAIPPARRVYVFGLRVTESASGDYAKFLGNRSVSAALPRTVPVASRRARRQHKRYGNRCHSSRRPPAAAAVRPRLVPTGDSTSPPPRTRAGCSVPRERRHHLPVDARRICDEPHDRAGCGALPRHRVSGGGRIWRAARVGRTRARRQLAGAVQTPSGARARMARGSAANGGKPAEQCHSDRRGCGFGGSASGDSRRLPRLFTA